MKSIFTTNIFDNWFINLRDRQAKARIQARIDRAELGNLGDYKAVGESVFEMRIHYAQGYRVYFTQKGVDIIILLAGGDKKTQSLDIEKAISLAKQL